MSSLTATQKKVAIAVGVGVLGIIAFVWSKRKSSGSDSEAAAASAVSKSSSKQQAPAKASTQHAKLLSDPPPAAVTTTPSVDAKEADGGLVLYTYDHCPFCAKAKMILGYKNVPYKNVVFANDDDATPRGLVGDKVVPILRKPDGTHMRESMDIVKYVDANFGGAKVLGTSITPQIILNWLNDTDDLIKKLVYPRYVMPEVGFEEFKTESARKFFVNKREGTIQAGSTFQDFFNDTPALRTELEGHVASLDDVIPGDGKTFLLSKDQMNDCDLHLYARLRSISIVKGFKWSSKTRKYIDFMVRKTNVKLFENVAV